MTTDIDIAIIQLRECAQSIGTYLPASSAATIAAAWDTLTAERDAAMAQLAEARAAAAADHAVAVAARDWLISGQPKTGRVLDAFMDALSALDARPKP